VEALGILVCFLNKCFFSSRSTTDTISLTGIQYAKAMGYKVAAIDISDAQLSNARSLGADLIYNSMADSTYLEKIKEETQGGCHAAIVFSAALPAYENAPKCLR
jgi:D-arabinose 1-dehydrogenase-like Zn-dependent alcohol dehydrogenase